jgi:hypothetical protein
MDMKWNGEFLHGMEELPADEQDTIAGGESLLFWIGYAAGTVVNWITK